MIAQQLYERLAYEVALRWFDPESPRRQRLFSRHDHRLGKNSRDLLEAIAVALAGEPAEKQP